MVYPTVNIIHSEFAKALSEPQLVVLDLCWIITLWLIYIEMEKPWFPRDIIYK